MNDWFTIERIDQETYAISEYKHYEETHCYLLLGKTKAILIDTGLGVSNIKEIVDSITSLPVQVLTTHVHWDHIGGHKYFKDFAVQEKEVDWIEESFPLSLSLVKQNLTSKPCQFPKEFSLDEYTIFQGTPTTIFHDTDRIELDHRTIEVIHTPGHSPGHTCFYERDKKYLYTGDLVYKGCLDAFYPTTDPKLFYESIQKVKKLDIEKILPGHHTLDVPTDIIGRIDTAFETISMNGKLKQGSGTFDFGDFQIRL